MIVFLNHLGPNAWSYWFSRYRAFFENASTSCANSGEPWTIESMDLKYTLRISQSITMKNVFWDIKFHKKKVIVCNNDRIQKELNAPYTLDAFCQLFRGVWSYLINSPCTIYFVSFQITLWYLKVVQRRIVGL